MAIGSARSDSGQRLYTPHDIERLKQTMLRAISTEPKDKRRLMRASRRRVAEHDLGAAAYAIRALRASVPAADAEAAGRAECRWQRDRLPPGIRDLVLEDQRRRNAICWSAFND